VRILVTDTLADSGLAILRAASDMELDYRPGLKDAALLAAVAESDALITRSGTAVTEELVNSGSRLRIVGRAGVDEGPDQALRAIDLAIHAVKRVFLAIRSGLSRRRRARPAPPPCPGCSARR